MYHSTYKRNTCNGIFSRKHNIIDIMWTTQNYKVSLNGNNN